MTLYSAIYRRLVADSTTFAIVGNNIWNGESRGGIFPAIMIDISLESDSAISKRPADHYAVTVEIVTTSEDARDTLVLALNGNAEGRGVLSRNSWTDANVSVVSVSSPSEQRTESALTGGSANAERQYFTATLTYEFIASV